MPRRQVGQRDGQRPRRARLVVTGVLIAVYALLLYCIYLAILASPLALLFGREPRSAIGLAEIVKETGWQLPREARLCHAERRAWLDETILAEFEMPTREARALLEQWRHPKHGDLTRGSAIEAPDPPYWWDTDGIDPGSVAEVWSASSRGGPTRSTIWVGEGSRGMAQVYLLWSQA
jgi:hypothetical protein